MITSVTNLPSRTKEEKANQKMIENFNKAAKELKSRYVVKIQYEYPHLYRRFLGIPFQICQIYYSEDNNLFSFINGLRRDVFVEVEDVLKKVPERWEVELR